MALTPPHCLQAVSLGQPLGVGKAGSTPIPRSGEGWGASRGWGPTHRLSAVTSSPDVLSSLKSWSLLPVILYYLWQTKHTWNFHVCIECLPWYFSKHFVHFNSFSSYKCHGISEKLDCHTQTFSLKLYNGKCGTAGTFHTSITQNMAPILAQLFDPSGPSSFLHL